MLVEAHGHQYKAQLVAHAPHLTWRKRSPMRKQRSERLITCGKRRKHTEHLLDHSGSPTVLHSLMNPRGSVQRRRLYRKAQRPQQPHAQHSWPKHARRPRWPRAQRHRS